MFERQRYLRALALVALTEGERGGGTATVELTVVVDTRDLAPDGTPAFDWGLPVEIPATVLADLAGTTDPEVVIIRNGVVLYAPGKVMLGRTTRIANQAQRRVLRALYPTCAIPGCGVGFDDCKIHHVIWWEHGGPTDLDNELPLCSRHHHAVHDHGWHLTLTADRTLTITLPDGTRQTTGPPRRRAA